MNRIIIDGNDFTSRSDLHDYLADKLDFPGYYGSNLDALADCLSEISEKTELILKNEEKLIENIPHGGKGFIRVFEDAEEFNSEFIKFIRE